MSLMPMVLVFADEYREKIVLGGNTSGISYDYSIPAKKQFSSQDILLICEGAVYNHPQYSLKTCRVLPQSCAYQVGTYFADSQCLTYTFDENFDCRLKNGIAAGRYARLRFAMNPIAYKTYFDILRYYY